MLRCHELLSLGSHLGFPPRAGKSVNFLLIEHQFVCNTVAAAEFLCIMSGRQLQPEQTNALVLCVLHRVYYALTQRNVITSY